MKEFKTTIKMIKRTKDTLTNLVMLNIFYDFNYNYVI